MSSAQWGLLGAVCGLFGGLGGWLVLRGWMGVSAAADRRPSVLAVRWRTAKAELPEEWARRYRWVMIAAVVVTVVVWGASGRPVHGLVAGAAVWFLPWIWHPAGSRTRHQIARLEAVAEWLQILAGGYSSGTTLDAAVIGSVKVTPEPIRPAVARLAGRLQQAVPPREAYRQFADELADGTVDHAVKAFLTHIGRGGKGLAGTLRRLAAYTARQAKDLRAVDTDRAKVRSSARWVAVLSLGFALMLILGTSYGEAYATAQGQAVLLLLSLTFAGSLMWLRRLAATRPAPRGLKSLAERTRERADAAAGFLAQTAGAIGAPANSVGALAAVVPALLVGGTFGAGIFLVWYGLRRRPGADLTRMLAGLDRTRTDGASGTAARALPERVGGRLLPALGRTGVAEADLRILGISPQQHVGTKALGAVAGVVMPPVMVALAALIGMQLPLQIPLLFSVALGAVIWLNADADVRTRARREREGWLHAVASYLERVMMARISGAAPEAALESEAEVGDAPADRRISAALREARLLGDSPWVALERLGEQVGVPELSRPAAAMRRASEAGVPIADVLATQADQLTDQLTGARLASANAASEVLRVPGTLVFMQLMVVMLYPGLQALSSLS
ncbi:type II secretion system F family protein [Streptomyces xiamenensis]|uniref:type II secretion system F family protein n=1 Tax=Streptomyces xiamenensis TaxID=408015 RepID=UPI0035D86A68